MWPPCLLVLRPFCRYAFFFRLTCLPACSHSQISYPHTLRKCDEDDTGANTDVSSTSTGCNLVSLVKSVASACVCGHTHTFIQRLWDVVLQTPILTLGSSLLTHGLNRKSRSGVIHPSLAHASPAIQPLPSSEVRISSSPRPSHPSSHTLSSLQPINPHPSIQDGNDRKLTLFQSQSVHNQSPSQDNIHAGFLVAGLVFLFFSNRTFLSDIELTLSCKK